MQTTKIDLAELKAAAERDPLAAYQAAGFPGDLARNSGNLVGSCPFHQEKTPSFTVFPDGGFQCFGCDAQGSIIDFHLRLNYGVENPGPEDLKTPGALDDLAERLGVAAKPAPTPEADWTVKDYAAHVLLPQDALSAWGVGGRDGGGVLIAYRDEDGELLRNRVRLNRGKRWWEKNRDPGGDKSYLYGLDHLGDGNGPLLIVEGESDCQIAWHCGVRALGAPGQTIFKAAWVNHLPAADTIYVLREKDATLPETVAKAIAEAELPDAPEVKAVEIDGGADLLDVWRDVGCNPKALREKIGEALQVARPVQAPGEYAELTQTEALLQLAEASTIELFTEAADHRPYVQVIDGDGLAVYEVRSSAFRAWLLRQYRAKRGDTPSTTATERCLRQLEAEALGPDRAQKHLNLRAAWHGETLLIDRGTRAWDAFEITADGWDTLRRPPAIFRRHSHLSAYPTPERGGDLHDLFELLPVASDRDRLLLLSWMIAGMIPDIPRPVLLLTGPQGSGKSTASRLLRQILDPSDAEILRRPRDEGDLIQALAHHYCCPFDNLTSLPTWTSDILCAAVTGVASTKRRLYSDDDDIVYRLKRLVILNGIINVAQRPDLLDRTLHVNLSRIENPLPEDKLMARFDAMKPALVGALLDALAKTLRAREDLAPVGRFRMADFAMYGRAAAEVLGYGEQAFLDAYEGSVEARHEEALEASPFATAIMHLMAGRSEWHGTASELLDECGRIAERERLDTDAEEWPGSARWASDRLKEAEVNLRETGIDATFLREAKGKRIIKLTTTEEDPFAAEEGDPF